MPVQQETPTLIEIKNLALGVVVFSDHEGTQVTWQGAGDPSGEDVQMVPSSVLQNPGFLRTVSNGVLEFVNSDVADTAHVAQSNAFRDRQAQGAALAADVIVPPESRGSLGLPCVGPGSRVGVECGTMVSVKAEDVGTEPPLCSTHTKFHDNYERADGGTWHRKET